MTNEAPCLLPITSSAKEARKLGYQMYSDPIFFQWQRGEKTEQEWLDAVQAVNDANPYPEVTE